MGNYKDEESFTSRYNRTCRDAFAQWFDDPTFNVAVTLNFNSEAVDLPTARRAIANCFFRVDRKLLGTRFTGRRDARTMGVFAFEHLSTNLHAHGLLQVAPERIGRFADLFPPTQRGIWCSVWPSGSQWTTDAYDPAGFARYFTKELRADSDPNKLLFLSDYFPAGN